MFSYRLFGLLFAAAVFASGCTSLALVDPYDPAIEAGLDSYSKAMTTFLKKQEQQPNSGATAFTSPESQAFYQDSEATLSNVVLHAEAMSTSAQCAPAIAEKIGLTQILANMSGSALQVDAAEDTDLSVSLQSGSCTVVALKALRANSHILEALHRKHGHLRPAVAALARGLLEDSIRIALRIEKSKHS